MFKIAIILFALMMSCSGHVKQDEIVSAKSDEKASSNIVENDAEYKWTKIMDSAAWKKSYNFQMLNVRDTLWTFHPDGNWYSADGISWTKSALKNSISNLAFLDYVLFKGAVLGLGHFEGNIEQFIFRPEIYASTNMKQWDIISKQSNLPQRFFYHPFIFNEKIWIVGGEDKKGQFADIWNSADGVHWDKQKDNAAFGKRSNSQVVELKGRLYLLNNDVWSSEDGLNWKLETKEIVKGEEVFGYSALVYDDQIWLLGCNRNGKFTSQVFVSSDGKNWIGKDAPWSPRGGIASVVYNGKIFMTGGKYGGLPNQPEFIYSNDLWTMEKN